MTARSGSAPGLVAGDVAPGRHADGMSDEAVRGLLRSVSRIAVVGLSLRPDRPSNGVFRFLAERGLDVVGVNPTAIGRTVAGRPVVGSLRHAMDLLGAIDLVDIFLRADRIPSLVDEAIAVGARAIWMQLGLLVPAAAAACHAAGLPVVMNRCPAIEWTRLGLPLA